MNSRDHQWLNHACCLGALALLSLCLAPSLQARLDAQLSLSNDYRYRGLDQSDHGMVVQGSIDYSSSHDWYVGVWASTVGYDFQGDDRSLEVDYYAGFVHRFSNPLAVDVSVIRYTYPGSHTRLDYDWTELQLSAFIGDRWTATYAIGDNWLGRDENSGHLEMGFRQALPLHLVWDITLGHTFSERVLGMEYQSIETGLARQFGPLLLRLSYTNVDRKMRQRLGTNLDRSWLFALRWDLGQSLRTAGRSANARRSRMD
ncbi:MAG: TorF family putative porin [Pseudomonadales bacterium]